MRATEPPHLRAWVDESGFDHARGPATYVLAAAILETALEEQVRDTMRSLRLSRQGKLHWRDEGAQRRRAIATTVAAIPAMHIVVVRTIPSATIGLSEPAGSASNDFSGSWYP